MCQSLWINEVICTRYVGTNVPLYDCLMQQEYVAMLRHRSVLYICVQCFEACSQKRVPAFQPCHSARQHV
jgi:hypothetical protein